MSFIGGWLERENARQAEALKTRSAWWFAGEAAFGMVALVKAVAIVMLATGVGGYALALLLMAGGLALLVDGIEGLRLRMRARRTGPVAATSKSGTA